MKDLASIFYHLGTFQYTSDDRAKAGMKPNKIMKMEFRFEEELWYQFCLSNKHYIPITVVYDLLKLFYIKEDDLVMQHKLIELKRIIDQYSKYTYRERESKLNFTHLLAL